MDSALVVVVPEAEGLVGPWRERYDPSAADGMPAHVTVVHPFVEDVTPWTERRLAELAAGEQAFDVLFEHMARFGDAVLYLDPEPDEGFRTLTRLIASDFGTAPYGGTIRLEDIKPHLTVIDAEHAGAEAAAVMDDCERALRHGLPIACRVEEIWLLARDDAGRWERRGRFPLDRPAA